MAAYNFDLTPCSQFGYFSISWANKKWIALCTALEAIMALEDQRFTTQMPYLKAVIDRLKGICGLYQQDDFTLSEPGEGVVYKASKCFDTVILEGLIGTDELNLLKDFYETMDRQLIDTDVDYKEQLEALGRSGVDKDNTVYIKLTEKKPWERMTV